VCARAPRPFDFVRGMKTRVSPTIIGVFVLGALALGVVALLTFGSISFFDKPQRFIVYFGGDESVNGLDHGSPVKLRGVRVGRVATLNLRYDEKKNQSVAAVVCEFNRDAITGLNGLPLNISSRAELQALIDRGLRARLEVQSLATGLLYVGLNFVDAKENPDPGERDSRYAVVPALPSAISEFQNSVTEILTNLKKADLAGLSRGLTALIADTRKQLNGLDLKQVADQWKRTGERIEALAADQNFKRTFDNLNGAVTDLRATMAKLDAQVEPTSAQLNATIAEAKKAMQAFNLTAQETRKFVRSQGGLGEELAGSLQHVAEAAESVKRLVDFLERNPNALITGRKRPE
jgi:paraquat-inducible protein B